MLGIIHRDARNRESLRKWLKKLRPDVITCEVSRYSLHFRRRAGQIYRERLDDICASLPADGSGPVNSRLRDLYSFIDIPLEFAIADEYSKQNNIGLYPVDMDLFSFLKLCKVDELISSQNIHESLVDDHEGSGSAERALADLYFHKGVTAFSYDEEMAMRDKFMCHKIGILRKRHRNGRFVHIAGWQHLRDPLSLYAPFQPVKIFPYD